MAKERMSILRQLKARLAVDSVDTNDASIYKNIARGPAPAAAETSANPRTPRAPFCAFWAMPAKTSS